MEVGSEVNVMCSLYNMGRIKLYNVKAKFEGEGIKSKEIFVGNVESGATVVVVIVKKKKEKKRRAEEEEILEDELNRLTENE